MFLKNKNIIFKIRRSKVTDYAALTLCVPIEFPIKFDTVRSGWSIAYIEGSQVINSKEYHSSG